MPRLRLTSRSITTFDVTGAFDEDAFRAFIRRMVESQVEPFIGSSGSGQGSHLSDGELLRVWSVAKDEAGDAVRVYANLPDRTTAGHAIETAKIAVAAGVDGIHYYGPTRTRSTPEEMLLYFDTIFGEVDHPASIAPNHVEARPSAQTLAEIANRHAQVRTIMMMGSDDAYFLALRDALDHHVDITVSTFKPESCLHSILMGADGIISNTANILPRTLRRYTDALDQRDLDQISAVYRQLCMFHEVASRVGKFRWHKMAMRALAMPGGFVRPPLLDPSDDDIARFRAAISALDCPEVQELLANTQELV